ncbi:hypothetical protein BGZ94_009224 [Podila epigama]|nr:hypothetical protein BGZ94_009224 [Podila epigama]
MSPAPSSGHNMSIPMVNGTSLHPVSGVSGEVFQQQQYQSDNDPYDQQYQYQQQLQHQHQQQQPVHPWQENNNNNNSHNISNWRSIFDAALVKAQQAVQLDELKETALATNLYAQAANDLGRVIPLCSSEKKKQSMLAIQAIYLDRVIQLKAASKATAAQSAAHAGLPADSRSSFSRSSSSGNVYSNNGSSQYSSGLPGQGEHPFGHNSQYRHLSVDGNGHGQQGYEQEERDQEPYQPQQYQTQPIPPQYQRAQVQHTQQQQQPSTQTTSNVEPEKGFRLFGKKRSKTQPSATQPPELSISTAQQNYNAHFSGGNGFMPFGEFTVNPNGYTSPQAETFPGPSPPVVVSPIYMTHAPPSLSSSTATPASALQVSFNDGEQQEQAQTKKSSSRWKPFGKKKSKSFSNGGDTGGAYKVSGDYQIPNGVTLMNKHNNTSPFVAALPHQLVDPNEQFLQFSSEQQLQQQQPHSDWFVGEADSENDQKEQPNDDFMNNTVHYYDEDEDVDPYYIADTKGRAQAFEGKDNGKTKQSMQEPIVQEESKSSTKKPSLKHSASSYSKDQPFNPTFIPGSLVPTGQSMDDNNNNDNNDSAGTGLGSLPVENQTQDDTLPNEQHQQHASHEEFNSAYDDYENQHYDHTGSQVFELDPETQQYYMQQRQELQAMNGYHHNQYHQEPTIMLSIPRDPPLQDNSEFGAGRHEQDHAADATEKKTKRGWFGKKKSKKDTVVEKPGDRLDEMARIMDEALFGGGSATASAYRKKKEKATKDKGKEKKVEPEISNRYDEYNDDDENVETYARPASMMPMSDQARTIPLIPPGKELFEESEEEEYDYYQNGSVNTGSSSERMQLKGATALAPVAYTPRTTYTPTDKRTSSPSSYDYSAVAASAALADTVAETQRTFLPFEQEQEQEQELETAQEQAAEQEQAQEPEPDETGGQEMSVIVAGQSDNNDDAAVVVVDASPVKKSKSKSFGLFKSKKSKDNHSITSPPFSPTSTGSGHLDDGRRSVHSEMTQKSSLHGEQRASEGVLSNKKGRTSEEYVPYEYQEEVEGPLMERVEVPENREIVGFVMPIQELVDYNLEEGDETAGGLDSWDSWVSQLESFEKVLSEKGMKSEKTKATKKNKEDKVESSFSGLSLSAKGSRSSIFSTGRSSTALELSGQDDSGVATRPMSVAVDGDMQSLFPRQSFQSSRSSGMIDLSAQQVSVQQAKKRWWNPKRKETTSVHRTSTAYSVSDQDQERYLNSLLQTRDLEATTTRANDDANAHGGGAADDDALLALGKEASGSAASLPTMDLELQVSSLDVSSSPNVIAGKSEQEVRTPTPIAPKEDKVKVKGSKDMDVDNDDDVDDEDEATKQSDGENTASSNVKTKENAKKEKKPSTATTTTTKKTKSGKPKLLPISTPLATLLALSNAEELWQYVQQAKTYATTRMNKGDKRSAAIALKRAQSLEARWQEVLLEMASSDEDEDELLSDEDAEDDEDDNDESEEEEEEEEVVEVQKKPMGGVSQAEETTHVKKTPQSGKDAMSTPSPGMKEEYDSDIDAEEERRALSRKSTVSRSDSAPDKYSKYKTANKGAVWSATATSRPLAALAEEEAKGGDSDATPLDTCVEKERRYGPEATLEQMLESNNMEDLRFHIQQLKTATVAKARSGDKMAALDGMKTVKVLQQKLEQLEEEAEDNEVDVGVI